MIEKKRKINAHRNASMSEIEKERRKISQIQEDFKQTKK